MAQIFSWGLGCRNVGKVIVIMVIVAGVAAAAAPTPAPALYLLEFEFPTCYSAVLLSGSDFL